MGKFFTSIIAAAAMALPCVAGNFQPRPVDKQQRVITPPIELSVAPAKLASADSPRRTANVTASQVAPGVAVINWSLTGSYASYADIFEYIVAIYDSEGNELGYDWFYAEDGEEGVATTAVLGQYLEPGQYKAYVEADYNGYRYDYGTLDFTITTAAENELVQISNLTAENSEDLSTTTISWTQTGTLPATGYTVIEVQSAGEVIYSSLEDEAYGKVAIESPVTVSLPKDKDYYIIVSEYDSWAQSESQYLTTSFIQHSVGVNPFTPVDLVAQVDGVDVTFSWKSSKAESVPNSTVLWVLDEDGNAVVQQRIFHEGDEAQPQSYTLERLAPGTYTWAVRPVAEDNYYITKIVYSEENFTTIDVEAPVISAVEQTGGTTESVTVKVTVTDNYNTANQLTYAVYQGEALYEDIELGNGTITINGLEKGEEYTFTLVVKDWEGNESEPFSFTVKTSADVVAPVITKAELKETGKYHFTVEVVATDDVTAAENLKYYVSIEGEEVAVSLGEDGTAQVAGLEAGSDYEVTVIVEDEAGNCAESDAIAFTTQEASAVGGNVDALPYDNTFATLAEKEEVGLIDGNGDGDTWIFPSNNRDFLYYFWNGNSADEWIITPALKLEADKQYEVTVTARSYDATYPDRIEVKAGTAPDVASLTDEVIPSTYVTSTSFKDFTNSAFKVAADGYYNIGVHANTPSDSGYAIYIDEIKVSEVPVSVGITNIAASRTEGKTVYRLDGRQVNGQLRSGLYIVNGKKLVVK